MAGLQGTHGDLSAGTLVAFTTLQSRLLIPINQLLQVSVDVQSSLALFGRIFELIDLRPRITDSEGALSLAAAEIRGEVALEDVSFRYGAGEDGGPAAPEEALREVSMLVAPGQLAALVGPSGAGKTTISNLVPRLYDVERGAVKIDGHDVRELRVAAAFDPPNQPDEPLDPVLREDGRDPIDLSMPAWCRRLRRQRHRSGRPIERTC